MAPAFQQLLSDYCKAFSALDIAAIKKFYVRDALLRLHAIEAGSVSTSVLHTGGVFESLCEGKVSFELAFWISIR